VFSPFFCLTGLSKALHGAGKKLSACVGSYPTVDNQISVFYDTAVINATVDIIRVMNYDMYYVGGRDVPSLANRPDCEGMGPTSTQPWAKQSMLYWKAVVTPHTSKLVMGLPAYSNEYDTRPFYGADNGTQSPVGPPTGETGPVEALWLFFDQIYTYRYGTRLRYGTEERSTRAHLRTAFLK